VCELSYRPTPGTTGTQGHVQFTTYTDPDCGGTLIRINALCTADATSSLCSSIVAARYERHGLLAVFAALQRAQEQNQSIAMTASLCMSGSGTCVVWPRFLD
jgi:hypothetical protein